MIITLSPTRSNAVLTVSKQGDVLTINDDVFDFSVVPDGGILPASAVSGGYFVGNITRNDGVLSCTLIAPHAQNPSHEAAFPSPLVNPPDGVLELPQ
jgi:hypothetical protein